MSYQNFIDAMELAHSCKFYTIVGGISTDSILESEKLLGLSFSPQSREFYEKYGYLSFFGVEIFGINPKDDSGILEGNSVAYALNDRLEFNLPQNWIPIYNYNDGSMAYLDYSELNSENEPPVIQGKYTPKGYEVRERVAEDFGTFLLELVTKQLEAQRK